MGRKRYIKKTNPIDIKKLRMRVTDTGNTINNSKQNKITKRDKYLYRLGKKNLRKVTDTNNRMRVCIDSLNGETWEGGCPDYMQQVIAPGPCPRGSGWYNDEGQSSCCYCHRRTDGDIAGRNR